MKLKNLARDFHRVDLGDKSFWFSYETIVAFQDGQGLVVSENIWSVTTGKHLNMIEPEKGRRVPHDDFLIQLGRVL